MDTRDLKERLRDPQWVKNWFDQAGFDAARRIEELEDALEMIGYMGHDMPAALEMSDLEWSRQRARTMQKIARDVLASEVTE